MTFPAILYQCWQACSPLNLLTAFAVVNTIALLCIVPLDMEGYVTVTVSITAAYAMLPKEGE